MKDTRLSFDLGPLPCGMSIQSIRRIKPGTSFFVYQLKPEGQRGYSSAFPLAKFTTLGFSQGFCCFLTLFHYGVPPTICLLPSSPVLCSLPTSWRERKEGPGQLLCLPLVNTTPCFPLLCCIQKGLKTQILSIDP